MEYFGKMGKGCVEGDPCQGGGGVSISRLLGLFRLLRPVWPDCFSHQSASMAKDGYSGLHTRDPDSC